jgi:hypothetical protein
MFHNRPGNIPDLSSVIVVPPTLIPQVMNEMRRYLNKSSFGILPYLGKFAPKPRETFWFRDWDGMKATGVHRILIASQSVSISTELMY